MRTVYATQFEIHPKHDTEPSAVWSSVLAETQEWVKKFYAYRQIPIELPEGGGRVRPTDRHLLNIETSEPAANSCLWTMEWTHPDDKDATLEWQILVTVGLADNTLEFAVVIRVSSVSFTIVPARFTLRRPNLVRKLVESHHCSNAGSALRYNTRDLGVADIREFVATTLANPKRLFPVVVVSKDLLSERTVVDADELADRLVSLAEVAVIADKWAGFQLTNELGSKSLSCYDGAVRLFWPGFSVYSDPMHHPLWLKETIRWHAENGRPLSDYLLRMLAAIASFRHTDGRAIRMAREAARLERTRHLEELRTKVAASGQVSAEQKALSDYVVAENSKLQKERDEANARLDELEQELQAAKANLETMYQFRSDAEQTDSVPATESPTVGFSTVLEATQFAQEEFKANLIFLDSAFDSAKKSPFLRPDRVFEALQAVDEVCSEWSASLDARSSMGTWEQAFGKRGFDYKDDISPTTRTKFGTEYTFVYEGRKLLFEKHITEGAKQPQKCFSIHMYRDEAKRKIVIGHVGRHLTNTSA